MPLALKAYSTVFEVWRFEECWRKEISTVLLKAQTSLTSLASVSMLSTVVYNSGMNFSPHDWLRFSCMIYRESYRRDRERGRGKKAKDKRELGLYWFEIIFWPQLASRMLFETHMTPLKKSLPRTQLTFHIKKIYIFFMESYFKMFMI